MSDQIKISIPLWGRGIFMSISGWYLQRRVLPQYKVYVISQHTHYCSRLINKNERIGLGNKKDDRSAENQIFQKS